MKIKNMKKERKISMPENEYRALKRREKQLLKAKNHIRIAWEAVRQIEEVTK
jgi:hypothetical protein